MQISRRAATRAGSRCFSTRFEVGDKLMERKQARLAGGVRAGRVTIKSALLASAATIVAASPSLAQDDTPQTDAAGTEDVIVVRGQFIPDEKRATSEIASVADSADFSLQGDGDAAVALRRISGLSLSSDSKFVFARGLNERYSTATLNGSPLPSPEPLRRTVPLDLFPTSVLETVLAQKTYSPQYSGEFGGAMVDLRTRTVPDERFMELSVSAGANDDTFLEEGLLYDGGGEEDYTGFDNGARNTTPEIDKFFGVARIDNSSVVSAEENIAAGLSLVDPSMLVIQRGDVAGDAGVRGAAGDRFDLEGGNVSVGVVVAGGYSSAWRTRQGEQNAFAVTENTPADAPVFLRDRFSTQQDISSNGLVSVGVDLFDNHEISALALAVRSTQKEARITNGPDPDDRVNRQLREDSTEWFERQVWTTQVQGTHFFPALHDLEVAWRASYSEALRDAPYQTRTPYRPSETLGRDLLAASPLQTDIDFSTVADDTTDFGVDLTIPFALGDRDIEVMGGYAYVENDREAVTRSYFYRVGSSLDPDRAQAQRIDVALSRLGSDPLVTFGETPADLLPDFHLATLEVDAFYLGIDAALNNFLRIAIGARYEDAIEAVQTRDTTESPEETASQPIVPVQSRTDCFSQGDQFTCALEKDPVLPAATLTWNFSDNMQLRLGYSQTIIRPQFREYAPGQFIDTETNRNFIGNPFLVNTRLKNYDARWEYYFARDQFLTLGAFYKELTNPIEEALLPVGNQFQTTFVNVPSATLYGGEVEFEKIFDLSEAPLVAGMAFFDTKDAIVRTNYTYTQSEISTTDGVSVRSSLNVIPSPIAVPSGVFEDGRPLQGTSEHLFNITLGYQDYEAQSRAALVFNLASERIRSSEATTGSGDAAARFPVVFEQPPVTLDFTYSRLFELWDSEFELGLVARNLLDEDYDAYQKADGAEFTFDRYDIGRTFGVSLSVRR